MLKKNRNLKFLRKLFKCSNISTFYKKLAWIREDLSEYPTRARGGMGYSIKCPPAPYAYPRCGLECGEVFPNGYFPIIFLKVSSPSMTIEILHFPASSVMVLYCVERRLLKKNSFPFQLNVRSKDCQYFCICVGVIKNLEN